MLKLLKKLSPITNALLAIPLTFICINMIDVGRMTKYVSYQKGFIDGVKMEKKATRLGYEIADPNDAIDFLWR